MDIEALAIEAVELSEKGTKGPWRIGLAGAIVSDNPAAVPMDEDAQRFYGGRSFVCESVTGDTARRIAHAGTHYGTLAKAMLDAIAACRAAATCEPGWLERVKAVAGMDDVR